MALWQNKIDMQLTSKAIFVEISMGSAHATSLSSDREGRMRLTATGVPRQFALRISPKEPWGNMNIYTNKLHINMTKAQVYLQIP